MNEKVIDTAREPYRVGYLMDWMIGIQACKDQYAMSQFAFDEAYERGLLDRPVELLIREVEGPPYAQVQPVIEAYKDLIYNQGCVAMIGPFITDVVRPVKKIANEAKVPMISYTATTEGPSEWLFELPNGTFTDETSLLANHLRRRGVKSVGVIREDNSMADEYIDFFREHARLNGITIVADKMIPTFIRDPEQELIPALQSIRDAGAEAIAYTAYGQTQYFLAKAYNRVSTEWNWHVPRVCVTTWVGVTAPGFSYFPEDISANPGLFEGWVGVDQLHEGNVAFQKALDRFEKKHGTRPAHCYASCGYDLANAMAIAISRAQPKTPAAIRDALETLRLIPAVTGGPGTVISFGPHDHRGYKGKDYVVLRTVHEGKEQLAELVYPECFTH